jgi:2-polyprenyl-6-methoxyphenol hydroxylase-like FAD-dependent oxidoreductase
MEKTPVLVVGAGLAGLSTAMYLGLHGVSALVVERHSSTSPHPKARGQFPHVMEALRLAGLDQVMIDRSPPSNGFRIVVAQSMTGRVFQEIVVDNPDFSALSTASWANVGQEVAEPILADRARELGAEIRFGTSFDSFEQDADGVTAVLRDLATDRTTTVRSDYLVGADGHRSPIREALGIGVTGRGLLGEGSSVLFDADLPPHQGLYYLRNPGLPGGSGALVTTDVPGRFALGVGPADATTDWTEVIRTATGVPDLVLELVASSDSATHVKHAIADRFSEGRVHLVGDAVRVMPPTGAFGGNTAIMDGFALAWKLAMVVTGQAGPRLLDSHTPERRPYSQIIADQQYTAFVQRMAPDRADDTLAAPIEPVSSLFFGYRHISDAVLLEPGDAGEPLENPERPSGRPGSRAPHVPLPGVAESTVDLFGRGFVLLTGATGHAWLDSAEKVAAELGTSLAAYRIDAAGWSSAYGVHEDGAVLVRPDFHIAWRSVEAGSTEALEAAVRKVLDRTE